jgi:prevent-host-death family protein
MRTFSATEARVHFGEILRRAQIAPVAIERNGKPLAVLVSKQEYDRLTKGKDWQEMAALSRRKIAERLQGRELPDPVEMIRKAREIRDEQIANALR